MHNIKTFVDTRLGNNTYLIKKGSSCIIIDPSFNYERYIKYMNDSKLKLSAILLTHGHYDHIIGIQHLQQQFDACIFCSEATRISLADTQLNRSTISVNSDEPVVIKEKIRVITSNTLMIDDFQIDVIQTPGHTLGCLSYKIQDFLFTGDFIFKTRQGRVDFVDSDNTKMLQSLETALTYDNGITIYPGHGECASIESVKKWIKEVVY